MKKSIFTLAILSIAMTSCFKKNYNCRCQIDLPDTAGYTFDVDTIFVVTARLDEEANVKCIAAEEASSFLATQYEAAGNVDINCNLE